MFPSNDNLMLMKIFASYSPSLSDIECADTVTALETLEKAITDWAKKQVNNQVTNLFLMLLSKQQIDSSGDGKPNQAEDYTGLRGQYFN